MAPSSAWPDTGPRVAVVGSANMDLVVQVHTFPRPGETVMGLGFSEHPGGKGRNQAVAAARTCATALIASFGADALGDAIKASLGTAGVELAHSTTAEGRSGVALISVTQTGENSIVVLPGSNDALTPEMTVSGLDALRPTVVLAQLEVPTEAVVAANAWAGRNGARWVFNPSPVASTPGELYRSADPLIVNAAEAGQVLGLLGQSSDGLTLVDLTDVLRGVCRSVVVTAGSSGAFVGTPGGVVRVEATRTSVRDTTGAGDAFAGTVAAGLAAGNDLLAAVAAGSAEAAAVVSLARAER